MYGVPTLFAQNVGMRYISSAFDNNHLNLWRHIISSATDPLPPNLK